MDQLRERLLKLVDEGLGVNLAEIAAKANKSIEEISMQHDAGADSLELVEVVMGAEDLAGITLSDEEMEKLTNVGEFLELILAKAKIREQFLGVLNSASQLTSEQLTCLNGAVLLKKITNGADVRTKEQANKGIPPLELSNWQETVNCFIAEQGLNVQDSDLKKVENFGGLITLFYQRSLK